MQSETLRALLVIDDRQLREERLEPVLKILKKMDRLQAKASDFHARDQRLFSDWFNLTFKDERDEIQARFDEYTELAKFHNDVLGLSRQLGIDLPEAYVYLRDEQRRWEQGGPEERARIDEERRRREEFIEREIHGEADEAPLEDEGKEDSSAESLLDEDGRIELAQLRDLSDDEIMELFEDPSEGAEHLLMALEIAAQIDDDALFLRSWDLASREARKEAEALFELTTGDRLRDIVKRMRANLEAKGARSDFREGDAGEASSDAMFEFIKPKAGSASSEDSAKALYRKLVRRLHPDLQTDRRMLDWMMKTWVRVQDAYKRRDVPALEKLLAITLLRGGWLNELSLDEIAHSAEWIKEDLRSLEAETRSLKSSPAWGFSSRKDRRALSRKLRSELQAELHRLDTDVRQLRMEQEQLAVWARMGRQQRGGRGRRGRW